MKIVKQMFIWNILGKKHCIKNLTLVVHIMIYLFFIWNSFCLKRSYNSLSLKKLHPSGASDIQDTKKLQQRAHSTLLLNYALKMLTFRTLLRTYLWQKQHDVEFESSIISFLGICPHSGWGCFLSTAESITAMAYSPSHLPALNRYILILEHIPPISFKVSVCLRQDGYQQSQNANYKRLGIP